MANLSDQSPTNPHFFQPLLPGFDNQLKIPVAFFSKYIDGRNEQKMAKLESNASGKTWKVEMEGRRLTRGWKDFATEHNFRIGDIIVFKHKGDMVFEVIPFGPSCCEIQYTKTHIKDEEEDCDDDNDKEKENQQSIRKVLRKKSLNPQTERESSLSYDYCFVVQVTASNLQVDTLHFPKNASNSKALNRRCHEIMVVNQQGKWWTLTLRVRESIGNYYMTGGWRRFCHENRYRVEDLIPFNLVGDGKATPLICVCPEEECSELIRKYKSSWMWNKKTKKPRLFKKTEKARCRADSSSSSREQRFVTIILKAYNIKNSKLILPVVFTKNNEIYKHDKINLMDKHGVKYLVKLTHDGPNKAKRGLGKGWKDFCLANDVYNIGEKFILELIWENAKPILRFCYKVKNEPISV